LDGRWRAVNWLSRVIQRRTDLTLVSNEALRQEVECNGGSAYVLPDRIPTLTPAHNVVLTGRSNVVFVCSYGHDEPYEGLFEAAALLEPDVVTYVTGDYSKHEIDPSELPRNVVLTGYLSDDDYVCLLGAADVVIDLTDRDDCLVCGAYEGLALHKPMVLSDTTVNRHYFDRGCVYASHNPRSLAAAVSKALAAKERLGAEQRELEGIRRREWEQLKVGLLQRLQDLNNTSLANVGGRAPTIV